MKNCSLRYLLFIFLSVKFDFSEASGGDEGQTTVTGIEHHTGNEAQFIETIVERKLEPLYKKMFDVQDAVATKMGTIADFEDNLYQKIKEVTDATLLEHTATIVKRISDIIKSDFIENRILELTKRIDRKLSVMQNDMQSSIVNKLEAISGSDDERGSEEEEVVEQKLKTIIEKIASINLASANDDSSNNVNLELTMVESKLKAFENSSDREMKELTDKISAIATNMKQTIALSELACNEKTMLDSLTVTNNALVVLENTHLSEDHINYLITVSEQIKTSITKSSNVLDTIKGNSTDIAEKIQELAKEIFIEQTKEVADNINSNSKENSIIETIESINKKLVKLDQIPKLEEDIDKLMNLTVNIEKYAEMSERATEDMRNREGEEARVIDPFLSFCDRSLQAALVRDPARHINSTTAADKDDLDRLMELHTGCTYGFSNMWKVFRLPEQANERPTIEWRFALRSPEHVRLQSAWGSFGGFYFNVGFLGSKVAPEDQVTYIEGRSTIDKWDFPSPDVLAVDRYVPFYLAVHRGNLTLGVACDSEPLFSHAVDIDERQEVALTLEPLSWYGVKLLYNCPPDLAARLGEGY